MELKRPVKRIPGGIRILGAAPEGTVIPTHKPGLAKTFLPGFAKQKNLRGTVTDKMIFDLDRLPRCPRQAKLV